MIINKPNYRWKGDLKTRLRTDYIVLHHAEAPTCAAEDVHRWHLNNGWAGIGYHFFVKKDGSVYEGRPLTTIGAHCLNYNNQSIGICAEGSYHPSVKHPYDKEMPEAQLNALVELVKDLMAKYPGIKVVGHRELNNTSCPGNYYPLDVIKSKVNEKPIRLVVNGQERDVPIRARDGRSEMLIDGQWIKVTSVLKALGFSWKWVDAEKLIDAKIY